jgi:hypothetical protein
LGLCGNGDSDGKTTGKTDVRDDFKQALGRLDAAFFAKLENVLCLYDLPYNRLCPVVCIDERLCYLIDNILTPIPMEEGKPKREDYEYKKNGSCTVFIAVEPLTGKRFIQVYKQRTGKEYTKFMQYLAKQYPEAQRLQLVQDNLSTHSPNMFYTHLKPEIAFELSQRFQMHYTPAKSSWLNMRPRPSGASWGQEGGNRTFGTC